ncbi:hypothetical protein MIR68_012298 [Amoeboaphelidium protococcarum]|nr:hypothetical protein MIR68_012298 [Amoeboaphelidium protococcarum]
MNDDSLDNISRLQTTGAFNAYGFSIMNLNSSTVVSAFVATNSTLRDEANVEESMVSMNLHHSFKTIAACMSVKIKLEDQQKVVVGGFMADSTYDYASKCDLRVSDLNPARYCPVQS